MPLDPSSPFVEWKFGPAAPRDGMSLREVIARARLAYERGVQAREVGWLDRARDEFYEATQLHGDEPVYQGALGGVLLERGYTVEAQAVLSAAVPLAPWNPEYGRLLSEARSRKQQ
jgi:predicted Zn-dependent protease